MEIQRDTHSSMYFRCELQLGEPVQGGSKGTPTFQKGLNEIEKD